jgi:hypothetical protein
MIGNLINSITGTTPLQIYSLNTFAFIISFTDASQSMKLILLFASIIFTVVKTIDIIKKWYIKDSK